jgi:hypothetical membrane protein
VNLPSAGGEWRLKMGLTWKDGTATLLVAGIGVLTWAHLTDQGWPGVSGPRVLAVVVFLIGISICVTTSRNLNAKEANLRPIDRIMRAHGIGAFILMLWAAISGSEVALGALVGLIGVMWLGSTVYHAFSERPIADS